MPTAAVVVTWEGGPTTDRCIDSRRAQREPPIYAALVVTSAALSALWGRLDAVRAMARGVAARLGGATHPPPARG